ncbi:hypothetical protein Lfee_1025 [Legionella feeleii]|uniref:Uncharacterized protein n=2 Tax=Legionella feeleii TaxID=453 RepID=A0A0W0U188_9GAMM|nr:hypothetical protein Lfee_1025 [Legionella feeleii]SPX61229.1 Uncharacterised protein [Legionella feeleii]STX38997.1 Uncharacterised protein [Legionella feeleii]
MKTMGEPMLRGVVLFLLFSWPFYLVAQDTELKFYRPFGEVNQQVPLVVKEEVKGQCWQQSERIKREDAWRCVVGDKTYDPCFVKQYGSNTQALCPQSPWIGDSVQIDLPAAVDNSQHTELNMAETLPWALELTTGEKCQAVDKGDFFDGLPVRYHCDSQTVLLGHIQRCKASWSILQRTASGVSTAWVAKAWF